MSQPMSRYGSAMPSGGQSFYSRQGSAMNGRISSARPSSGQSTIFYYLKTQIIWILFIGRVGSALGHRLGPVAGTASRLTGTFS